MRRLIGQFRLALVILLAFLVVMIDSASRILSMCADLVLVAGVVALCWGPLTRSSKEKDKG